MYAVCMDNTIRETEWDLESDEIRDLYESMAARVVFRIDHGKVQYAEPSTEVNAVGWITAQRG